MTEDVRDKNSEPVEPDDPPWKKKLRHDLRTPINQIIGYSEMLEEEAAEAGQSEYVPDLQKIQKAARTLLAGIDQWLSPGAAAPPPAAETSKLPEPETEAEETDAGIDLELKIKEGPAHILVVDDNEMNRDMLSRRLKRRDYRVDMAEDGQQALDLIDKESFDLVLLDIMMPGLSGYDVLKKVRETRSPSELPIIMATAKGEGEDIVAAFKLGANDYVTKPIDFPVALVRIETQLSLKHTMEEVRVLAEALERHNKFIRKTFGRYLSQEVVDSILDTPEGLKLGGEKRTVTVLMSDLRGFSAVSEGTHPERVVTMLNNYLGKMAEIIGGYNGTIDEFIGDAVLALFGAPVQREDDAERGVACAVAMQLAMDSVNETNRELGFPDLQMGIAINTGEVVVGNIGSQKRSKYGVVGSQVNLTGRIESYTVGGQILVSQATVDAAGPTLKLGTNMSVGAKGFKDPIVVHEVLGVAGSHDLFLRDRDDKLRELVRAIPLRACKLVGKQLCDDEHEGAMTSLSLDEGEMTPRGGSKAMPFKAMDNVRIRFTGLNGVLIPGDLYAKVMSDGSDRFKLHFTSVPPDIKAFIQSALANDIG